jgi:hypothetical protein
MALLKPIPAVKREVLRLLVQSIVVEEDAIPIKDILPMDGQCRLLPLGNRQKTNYQCQEA